MEFSATREEKQQLLKHFPLIRQVSNKDHLRDMVIETWVRVWRASPYRDIAQAPNVRSDQGADDSLVRHTNAVVRMARAALREMQKLYGFSINYDYFLAGAILHDVDKMVVLERKGNVVEQSELGRKVPHGRYGASIAEQVGLPKQVVNIIASHNAPIIPGAPDPASVEAAILSYCDLGSFQAYLIMSGNKFYRWS